MSFLHLYAVQSGSGAYLSQPTLGKVSHQLSLSARTLKTIASPVTWNAWEVEMKGCREKEEGVERAKKDRGERKWWGRGKEMQGVSTCWYLHCDTIPLFFVVFQRFNTSCGQTDLLNCWEIKETVSVKHTARWSWKFWHLGRWIPDKDRI